jgi:hypothetical protein
MLRAARLHTTHSSFPLPEAWAERLQQWQGSSHMGVEKILQDRVAKRDVSIVRGKICGSMSERKPISRCDSDHEEISTAIRKVRHKAQERSYTPAPCWIRLRRACCLERPPRGRMCNRLCIEGMSRCCEHEALNEKENGLQLQGMITHQKDVGNLVSYHTPGMLLLY